MKVEDWHEWRSHGLGSSDAPIVLGVSPWSTPYELWEQKTKRVKKDFSNWATDRGNKLEPVARASYEFENSIEAPPTLVVNPEFPFIRASLDGFCAADGIILEIKCPGKADHETALNGRVPEKYYPQLQHQFLACPEAKVAHYYSFDGTKGVLVIVGRDEAFIKTLFELETKFWHCIQKDTPPELTEKDFKRIDDAELEEKALCIEQLQKNLKRISEMVDKLKEELFSHETVKGRRVQLGDKWRINLCHRKGTIDYAKIPELKEIDLEKYRKPMSSYRLISEVKP